LGGKVLGFYQPFHLKNYRGGPLRGNFHLSPKRVSVTKRKKNSQIITTEPRGPFQTSRVDRKPHCQGLSREASSSRERIQKIHQIKEGRARKSKKRKSEGHPTDPACRKRSQKRLRRTSSHLRNNIGSLQRKTLQNGQAKSVDLNLLSRGNRKWRREEKS